MLKKGDEVMFFFFKDAVHAGRGIVHKVHPNEVEVLCTGNKSISLHYDNVYPYDNDRYIEMCDTHEYRGDMHRMHRNEVSRLRKICKGEHHA